MKKKWQAQRERARAARQDVDSMQIQGGMLGDIKVASEFVGYDQLQTEAQVVAIVKDGDLITEAHEGEEVQIILDKTPFYAESGGQIADKGTIFSESVKLEVLDVQKAPNGQNLHRVVVDCRYIVAEASVSASVDQDNRSQIIKNHQQHIFYNEH